MAIQADGSGNKPVKTTATGNAADTGTPVSLPPTRRAAPDEVSSPRSPQNVRSGYGMNGYAGASSIEPGTFTRSPLGDNLADTVSDPALAAVISGKPIGNDGPTGQERPIPPGNVPDHPAMASARSRQPTKG